MIMRCLERMWSRVPTAWISEASVRIIVTISDAVSSVRLLPPGKRSCALNIEYTPTVPLPASLQLHCQSRFFGLNRMILTGGPGRPIANSFQSLLPKWWFRAAAAPAGRFGGPS